MPPKLNFINQPPFSGTILLGCIVAGYVLTLYVALKVLPPGVEGAPQIITAGIPMFLSLMLVEMALTSFTKFPHKAAQYTYLTTWSNVAAGITEQVLRPVLQIVVIQNTTYTYIYNEISGMFVSEGFYERWHPALLYLFALAAFDLQYYWAHRQMHTISFLWSGHNVHHSTDSYNLSTALRQSWWQACTSWIWYLPSAVIGIPPVVQLTVSQFDVLYQFWVHTCHVRRLGLLEYILSTPAAHRIHHDRRVHKNFGGVFIVWDIIFGTFADEGYDSGFLGCSNKSDETVELKDEVCFFGTSAHPTTVSEPVHQMFGWVNLLRQWSNIGFTIRGPGFSSCVKPRQLPKDSSAPRMRNDEIHSNLTACYGVIQTLLAVASHLTCLFMPEVRARHAIFVWSTLLIHGIVYDGNYRTVGLYLEVIRLLVAVFVFHNSDIRVELLHQVVSIISLPVALKLMADNWRSASIKTHTE
eukprot:TRINITY_DN3716_c0_g1_i1.p1 TRINITY_DN3716_c0_g1~~TRINITY_DN3716_c0_g1_i1.p1  ORF type:complete len:469 (+),score=50.51 TRINITY_DN3716_c0_g1_i1:83-1489(+)